MSNPLFVQRRECRAAALQFLYAWSMNTPANLVEDLRIFFEHLEKPRDYYAFADELIHGTLEHREEIDGHIRSLAHNWEFDRIAKIDLAILRLLRAQSFVEARVDPSLGAVHGLALRELMFLMQLDQAPANRYLYYLTPKGTIAAQATATLA